MVETNANTREKTKGKKERRAASLVWQNAQEDSPPGKVRGPAGKSHKIQLVGKQQAGEGWLGVRLKKKFRFGIANLSSHCHFKPQGKPGGRRGETQTMQASYNAKLPSFRFIICSLYPVKKENRKEKGGPLQGRRRHLIVKWEKKIATYFGTRKLRVSKRSGMRREHVESTGGKGRSSSAAPSYRSPAG